MKQLQCGSCGRIGEPEAVREHIKTCERVPIKFNDLVAKIKSLEKVNSDNFDTLWNRITDLEKGIEDLIQSHNQLKEDMQNEHDYLIL